jgi:hypothetical protein
VISLETAYSSYQANIEQLNSSYQDISTATITNLMSPYATKDEAVAISAQQLKSAFNVSDLGSINQSIITTAQTTVNTAIQSYAAQIVDLSTSFQDQVTTNQRLVIEAKSTANRAMTNWGYGSSIKMPKVSGGYSYYNSGFGLVSTGTTVGSEDGNPVYDSEFWVRADKFRISSATSGYTPFEVKNNAIYLNSLVHIGEASDAPRYYSGTGSPSTVAPDGSVYKQTVSGGNPVYWTVIAGTWQVTSGVRPATSASIDVRSNSTSFYSTTYVSSAKLRGGSWVSTGNAQATAEYFIRLVSGTADMKVGDTLDVNVVDSLGNVLKSLQWVYSNSGWVFDVQLLVHGSVLVSGSVTAGHINTNGITLGSNSVKVSGEGMQIKVGSTVRVKIGNLDWNPW